jgi:hypothetical protein
MRWEESVRFCHDLRSPDQYYVKRPARTMAVSRLAFYAEFV